MRGHDSLTLRIFNASLTLGQRYYPGSVCTTIKSLDKTCVTSMTSQPLVYVHSPRDQCELTGGRRIMTISLSEMVMEGYRIVLEV